MTRQARLLHQGERPFPGDPGVGRPKEKWRLAGAAQVLPAAASSTTRRRFSHDIHGNKARRPRALTGPLTGASFVGGVGAAMALADSPFPRPGSSTAQIRRRISREHSG